MFANIKNFFKKLGKKQDPNKLNKEEAKERLHLVLLQDRANVSADFLEMMKQEIIEVIKKYIDIDENEIDVKLTNKQNSDGTTGAPALYANIPIVGIKNTTRKITNKIKLEEIGNNENDDEKSDKNKPRKVSAKGKNKKGAVKKVKTGEDKKEGEKTEKVEKQENIKDKKIKKQNDENADKVEKQDNKNADKVEKQDDENAVKVEKQDDENADKEINEDQKINNKNNNKQKVKQK